MKRKTGERTLLASVLLSSPGPLVVGIGLLIGRSSTQLADFVRRSAELAAIIVSWLVYRATYKNIEADEAHKLRLERTANLCVGVAMCISGAIMLILAFISGGGEKGNVIPGLSIAVLGVITNSWFWLRYRKLNRAEPNAILAVQARLYCAKSIVDACVTAALATVAFSPKSVTADYIDAVGSVVVSIYLIINGLNVIFGKKQHHI